MGRCVNERNEDFDGGMKQILEGMKSIMGN